MNGLPAGDSTLEDGDEIQMGSSLFVLQLSDPPEDATVRLKADATGGIVSDSVHVQEDAAPASTAIVMRREDVFGDAPFHRMATTARLSRDLAALIRASAAINAIRGLVARSIHRNSPRAGRAFVAINCAAITETLLESELFGHEKGAFTGAITQKKGKLEIAEGGTVLLDEIEELSITLQAKMLRVLQEKAFERVGGTRPVHVDFRLVAATNRDLKAAIDSGTFRRDLYYRLNVVSLAMPPLRDRRDDIPLLARTFLRRQSDKTKRQATGFSAEALACLVAYDWPGNIRELENAIEHAAFWGRIR